MARCEPVRADAHARDPSTASDQPGGRLSGESDKHGLDAVEIKLLLATEADLIDRGRKLRRGAMEAEGLQDKLEVVRA